MEMMTNSKAVKDTVVMQSLVSENAQKSYASSIGFYGDMDGMLVLVFPKDIAKKSCELLLGESTDDEEEILDALAEFVNIIGGRVKTLLSEQKISVDITLPRTYQKVSDLLEVMQGKKGVQVNLKFDQDEFIFFLTR
jgi:CheY-specific phosphatase CheX